MDGYFELGEIAVENERTDLELAVEFLPDTQGVVEIAVNGELEELLVGLVLQMLADAQREGGLLNLECDHAQFTCERGECEQHDDCKDFLHFTFHSI